MVEEFSTNAPIENTYSSDHDAVIILIEKIADDFGTISRNLI